MSKAYSVLKSLPVRIGVGISWLIGVAGFVMTDDTKKQVFGSFWTTSHFLAICFVILVLTNLYTLSLWLLKPSASSDPHLEEKPKGSYDTALLTKGLQTAITNDAEHKADMQLNHVLIRIYKIMGPAPDDPIRKQHFTKRVDLELADKVHLKGMALWGRYGNKPLRAILGTDQIEFDHRNGRVTISVNDHQRLVYHDIHFYSAEVNAVWPRPQSEGNA